MASGSEIAKMPEKSSFSVTCSVLSQYMKEKGSLADLGLAKLTCVLASVSLGRSEVYRPMKTMSLLPAGETSSDDTKGMKLLELFTQSVGLDPAKAEAKEQQEKSQLTIFYGGKVLAFDNFSAVKARDLMHLASKGQNFSSGTTSMVSSSATTAVVDAQNSSATAKPLPSFQAYGQPNFSDVPIVRKASLHRFLEKRKDRINAMTPYQPSKSTGSKEAVTVKGEISQPWLGFGTLMRTPGLNSDYNK